jgi:hypothetical protein
VAMRPPQVWAGNILKPVKEMPQFATNHSRQIQTIRS